MLRLLRIAREFARIGVIRKSQFRVEFLSQVVMDCLWYLLHILVFEVLFLHVPRIAGWALPEVRVYLGFVFIADAFMMMWLGKAWWFGRDLKDGNLDPVRVRPAPTLFLYFFQSFSPEACLNMAVAMGYLGWGIVRCGRAPDPRTWAVLPWAVLLSWTGMTVWTILFSTIEFYLVHSDLSRMLHALFGQLGEQPLDIYAAPMRIFLLFVVPVGLLSYVPASLVLGKIGPAAGLFHSAWLLGLAVLTVRLWNRSLRRYESAMG